MGLGHGRLGLCLIKCDAAHHGRNLLGALGPCQCSVHHPDVFGHSSCTGHKHHCDVELYTHSLFHRLCRSSLRDESILVHADVLSRCPGHCELDCGRLGQHGGRCCADLCDSSGLQPLTEPGDGGQHCLESVRASHSISVHYLRGRHQALLLGYATGAASRSDCSALRLEQVGAHGPASARSDYSVRGLLWHRDHHEQPPGKALPSLLPDLLLGCGRSGKLVWAHESLRKIPGWYHERLVLCEVWL
mmetsp:Transcript_2143/g.4934  ORF Transcript_2143/g.4934 Transcript_2143/m.4934 type:complete len:246 (+) Transcript_2143:492-1229(+)